MNAKLKIERNGDKVRIETEILVGIKKKARSWSVFSPDFKTLGFSTESKEAAFEDFRRALNLFFKIHLQRGSLEQTLLNFNWVRVDPNHSFLGTKRFNNLELLGIDDLETVEDTFDIMAEAA